MPLCCCGRMCFGFASAVGLSGLLVNRRCRQAGRRRQGWACRQGRCALVVALSLVCFCEPICLSVGAAGKPGADGKAGPAGKDGKDGKAGPAGKDGKAGLAGKDGKDGKAGPPGKDGKDGKAGLPGKDGKDGLAGCHHPFALPVDCARTDRWTALDGSGSHLGRALCRGFGSVNCGV